jgi:hypothetical protein
MTATVRKHGMGWDEEFRSLYDQLRETDSGIVALEPEALQGIAKELSRQGEVFEAWRYIAASIGATFLLSIATVLVIGCWKLSGVLSLQMLQIATHPGPFAWPCYILAFTAIIYAIEPLLSAYKPIRYILKPGLSERLPQINVTDFRYWLFACLGLYLAFPIAFSAAVCKLQFLRGSVQLVATVWLAPPCVLLSLLVVAFAIISPIYKFNAEPLRCTVQHLALDLMRLIKLLDRVGPLGALGRGDRESVLVEIGSCARQIQRLYDGSENAARYWAQEQLTLAAVSFLSLATWVYFPQQGTVRSLRIEVFRYLNIFLTGNLHELPRGGTEGDNVIRSVPRTLSNWKKATVYVSALAYLCAPPVVLIAVSLAQLVSIPAAADAPLATLYLVWVVCGIAFFADKLSADAGERFIDLIKTVFGRK